MNEIKSELLIDSYVEWYKQKVSFKQLKKASQIITPYVNHINDRISVFVEILPDDSIKLSDDGVTFNELSMMSLNIETKTRKRIIDETLKNFSVSVENEILYVLAENIKEFPQQKHNLMQCILRLYDLLFTDIPNVKSLFKEEVLHFLFENDFGGSISPRFKGESGIVHNIDYSLGATKSRPNTLMKFQNRPSFGNVTEQKFIADDLKQEPTLRAHGFRYVMVIGEEDVSEKVNQAANFAGIELLYFKDKEKLLSLK